jgi:hypothetical protein
VEVSKRPTARIDRGSRQPLNGPQAGLYISRTANSRPAHQSRTAQPAGGGVRRLHELAGQGRLAQVAAAAGVAERLALTSAAYDVAWPIVFNRLTRRIEQRRNHPVCAIGVDHLADDCLDRFHDDVEAVVDDLLAHARQPVHDLEGWIAGRLTAATVDAHRRRRGERGALQRPRLPGWLAAELGHDRWLMELAVQMLVWVGVTNTAGTSVWPLESWAQQRAAHTGDWAGSDPAAVAREVDRVVAAMRRRPDWYESYVERPLGRKQAPVAALPPTDAPLALADPDESVEAEMRRLAADAVGAIGRRLGRGEQTQAVVAEVIRAVFGRTLAAGLDRAPHARADPLGGVTGALADPATLQRIVATVRTIIDEREA